MLDVGMISENPAAWAQDSSRPYVSLAAVGSGSGAIQGEPFIEFGNQRPPGEPGVVAVADGNQTTGPADPWHLAQGLHRVSHMLEHLMGVDDVERVVGYIEGEDVSELKLNAADTTASCFIPSPRQRLLSHFECGHHSRCHHLG